MNDVPTSRKSASAVGSFVYFTGKPCLLGHISNRQTKNGQCLECKAIKRNSAGGKIITAKTGSKRYNNPKNRLKFRAQWNVKDAIKRGDLIPQPCERCGAIKSVQAHHEDYGKPLDIMWLCAKHHKERHRELNALAAIGGEK